MSLRTAYRPLLLVVALREVRNYLQSARTVKGTTTPNGGQHPASADDILIYLKPSNKDTTLIPLEHSVGG